MRFNTLDQATTRFRLREPGMSNSTIAQRLEVRTGAGDHHGLPACCFFRSGGIAAIRTKQDEIVVFHVFQSVRAMIEEIADKIEANEPEETHS